MRDFRAGLIASRHALESRRRSRPEHGRGREWASKQLDVERTVRGRAARPRGARRAGSLPSCSADPPRRRANEAILAGASPLPDLVVLRRKGLAIALSQFARRSSGSLRRGAREATASRLQPRGSRSGSVRYRRVLRADFPCSRRSSSNGPGREGASARPRRVLVPPRRRTSTLTPERLSPPPPRADRRAEPIGAATGAAGVMTKEARLRDREGSSRGGPDRDPRRRLPEREPRLPGQGPRIDEHRVPRPRDRSGALRLRRAPRADDRLRGGRRAPATPSRSSRARPRSCTR
jgi:hypothetical protein